MTDLLGELLADEAERATERTHQELLRDDQGGGGGYVLTIVPVRSQRWAAIPEGVRLRRLLKRMLRAYGFRCQSARPAP